ncbi:hypothetical protein V502_04802 [Pseudogymnoascus sp. VKM F-4520 (FW-2644)]|nr:hypothetical protein V502_04802 [Pseudogymnoascus sp. VKM F-4520 (FW-2644)]
MEQPLHPRREPSVLELRGLDQPRVDVQAAQRRVLGGDVEEGEGGHKDGVGGVDAALVVGGEDGDGAGGGGALEEGEEEGEEADAGIVAESHEGTGVVEKGGLAITSPAFKSDIPMGHKQQIEFTTLLSSQNLHTHCIHILQQRQVRAEEDEYPPRANLKAVRDEGRGARFAAANDVDARSGAISSQGTKGGFAEAAGGAGEDGGEGGKGAKAGVGGADGGEGNHSSSVVV